VTRALLLLAFACRSHDAPPKPSPPPPDQLARAVVRPVPPGPYRVTYGCSQPTASGKIGAGSAEMLDLGAMTRTTLPDGPQTLDAPAVANVSPSLVAMISDNVDRVLAGGPYRAELPAPGAVGCTLTIEKGEQKLLVIEKSDTKEHDAVSELVHAFRP
jgi:hypothetical protein